MGIFDKIGEKMQARKEDKQLVAFKKQIADMLAAEKYTMSTFALHVDEGVSSWTTKMPLVRSRPEVAQIRKTKTILDAFTAAERDNPSTIGQAEKLRAAGTAKETLAEVEGVIQAYEQAECMHRWLRTRQKRGQKIPKNQQELMELARDPRGLTMMKFMKDPPQRFAKGITTKTTKRQPLLF
jgi:signal recognition particle GTPase